LRVLFHVHSGGVFSPKYYNVKKIENTAYVKLKETKKGQQQRQQQGQGSGKWIRQGQRQGKRQRQGRGSGQE